ncbi:srpr [Symbiodinium sp. CCMP2456]|nr:srpr [Symbiodinium sp. CCMP2456]
MKPPFFVAPLLTLLAQDSDAPGRQAWTPSTHAFTVSPGFAAHHQQGDHLKPSHKPSVLPAAPIFTVFGVAVVIGLIALASKWRDRACPASFALSVNLMICVQGFINYSSVILCAYPLCLELGATHATSMSGFFIGVYMTASAVGTAVCWKILGMFSDAWQTGGVKHFLLGGLSCQLLGALGFVKVALDGSDTDDNSWIYFLMAARVLQSFGHGMNDQVMKCCIVKLSPVADRPVHSLHKFVANTVGIGSGPILVAVVFFFFQSPHEEQESAKGSQISIITASLQFWTTSAVLAATAQLYPTMKVATTDSSKAAPARGHQASVLVVSLVMDALRAFIVSGVESATCLLLQEKFAWGNDSIGFCIGVTFCLVVPVYMLHRQYHEAVRDLPLMKIYTTLGIVATVLLGTAMHPQTILAADSIIFPTTYLAGALNMGILNSNVFPDGSILDANNVMLINGLISNGVGRFGGPVFSRSLIADLGQKAYAACQALAMLSVLAGTSMLEHGWPKV